MRIIAGRLRGATLKTPKTSAVRPTYDRVRESVFSILEPRLAGAAVLDLFAGSGSLGIESLSRGAGGATFVEKDRDVMAVVSDNIRRLGLTDDARLVRADAVSILRRSSAPGSPFDLVFVDPPYASGLAAECLSLLGSWTALSPSALVIVEHDATDPLPESSGRLSRFRVGRYGTTVVDFYEARDKGAGGRDQT